MAKPTIARTPELKGKEATSFLESLFQRVTHVPTKEEKHAKEKERERMKASYKALQSISNEPF